jgi:hypothetical protein
MRKTVYTAALERAALILGGDARLREYLGVDANWLDKWLQGVSMPPPNVFLKVVDVVSQESLNRMTDARVKPAGDTQASRYGQAQALAGSRAAKVRLLRKSIQQSVVPTHDAPTVSEFLDRKFDIQEAGLVLQIALDSAIAATSAQFGTMQLLEPDGLHLVVQHGFSRPFVDFFAFVDGKQTTCAVAMEKRARVVVEDVEVHAIFKGTPSGAAMLAANARAVQSTPLISASGDVLGVFSTHYDHRQIPSERDLAVIDHIGDRATYWLDKTLDALMQDAGAPA